MADHVLIDDGSIAGAVRELLPGGVGAALELVQSTPRLVHAGGGKRVGVPKWSWDSLSGSSSF